MDGHYLALNATRCNIGLILPGYGLFKAVAMHPDTTPTMQAGHAFVFPIDSRKIIVAKRVVVYSHLAMNERAVFPYRRWSVSAKPMDAG